MNWLTADLVNSFGVAISAVIAAVFAPILAWQGREVKKLQTRVADLEVSDKAKTGKIRDAARFIRQLLAYIDKHVPSDAAPMPAIPESLAEEL